MATKQHFDDLGEKLRRGGKAIAAIMDGRTVGVAGYYLDNGRVIVFSTITPELRLYKRTIVKGAAMVMDMANRVQAPAHALADPETYGSDTLLRHFGFEQLDRDIYGRKPWRRQVH